MGFFATRSKRDSAHEHVSTRKTGKSALRSGRPHRSDGTDGTGSPRAHRELSADQRSALPPRFEAVAEALLAASSVEAPCQVAGHELAKDGVSLEEAMTGLRETWRALRGTDPDFDAMTALLVAWSDTTLGYLHQLSCEDALTGLASLAHLRTRITELYRHLERGELNDSYALVVCELPIDPLDPVPEDSMVRSMQMTRLGESARTVFSRGETVGRVGGHRVAVLATRDDRLGRRVRVLRNLLAGIELGGRPARVWIEGLPGNDMTAAALLDELARV